MYVAVKFNDATGQPIRHGQPIRPGKNSSTSDDIDKMLDPFQKPRGHSGNSNTFKGDVKIVLVLTRKDKDNKAGGYIKAQVLAKKEAEAKAEAELTSRTRPSGFVYPPGWRILSNGDKVTRGGTLIRSSPSRSGSRSALSDTISENTMQSPTPTPTPAPISPAGQSVREGVRESASESASVPVGISQEMMEAFMEFMKARGQAGDGPALKVEGAFKANTAPIAPKNDVPLASYVCHRHQNEKRLKTHQPLCRLVKSRALSSSMVLTLRTTIAYHRQPL